MGFLGFKFPSQKVEKVATDYQQLVQRSIRKLTRSKNKGDRAY